MASKEDIRLSILHKLLDRYPITTDAGYIVKLLHQYSDAVNNGRPPTSTEPDSEN